MEISEQVAKLYQEATAKQASDIYFLPFGNYYLIKIRDPHAITTWQKVTPVKARRMMNYCKYMADMALSETRRPQTGSMAWQDDSQTYSLRLSTVGDFAGAESLVIRIIYDLKAITTSFFNSEAIREINNLASRRGLVIFSGPTGSGKTTTIYNLVQQNLSDQFVMTIEDPVEIKESRYLQLQVNREAGMDYADLIKVGLRHRPDIFIIGEIRDQVTAEAAIKAVLSGHLVYATIHAQDPVGVISRLQQLGISDHFIAQALTAVGYQRLIPTTSRDRRALLMVHEYAGLMEMKSYDWRAWQDELNDAVTNHQITRTSADQYWFG